MVTYKLLRCLPRGLLFFFLLALIPWRVHGVAIKEYDTASVEYSVDTVMQIPFLKASGKGLVPYSAHGKNGVCFGTIAFDVCPDSLLFVYDECSGYLYKYDWDGDLLLRKPIYYNIFDIKVIGNQLCVFDGKNVIWCSLESLNEVKKVPVNMLLEGKLVTNKCFFYKNYLFIRELRLPGMSSAFSNVFHVGTYKIFARTDGENMFLPLNKCQNCENEKLIKVLFNKEGNTRYIGQSDVFIAIERKTEALRPQDTKTSYMLFDKIAGRFLVLKDISFNINPFTTRSFNFISDSVAICEEVIRKNGNREKLIYRRINFKLSEP